MRGHDQSNRTCSRLPRRASAGTARSPSRAGPRRPRRRTTSCPVAIDTSLGRIVIALDRGRAPITTANFLRYVDAHRLDGETFYRAMTDGRCGGLIQGGVRSDARKLFPPIVARADAARPASRMSPARSRWPNAGPARAQADFFILLSDMPGFDAGGPAATQRLRRLRPRHRRHGRREEDLRRRRPPPTKGEGVMKGQMLEPPVKIIKAARVKSAAGLDQPDPLLRGRRATAGIAGRRGSCRSPDRCPRC